VTAGTGRLVSADQCKLKGELGELQLYFRKILLHQQKFLVVLVLSNSPWLPTNLKKCPT